jgi:hypothetical protein
MTVASNEAAESWVVSYNVKDFDLVSYLSDHDQFVMKRTRPLKDGDFVFLYIAKPYGYVKYYCKVLNAKVDDTVLEANSYAKVNRTSHISGYMKLEVLQPLSTRELDFSSLRAHGVGQLLNPSRVSGRTLHYLEGYVTGRAE